MRTLGDMKSRGCTARYRLVSHTHTVKRGEGSNKRRRTTLNEKHADDWKRITAPVAISMNRQTGRGGTQPTCGVQALTE